MKEAGFADESKIYGRFVAASGPSDCSDIGPGTRGQSPNARNLQGLTSNTWPASYPNITGNAVRCDILREWIRTSDEEARKLGRQAPKGLYVQGEDKILHGAHYKLWTEAGLSVEYYW